MELSFDIFEGEVFGLLGPNGAGKTTTISMLATQRPPSAGDATLFGHSIRKEPKAIRQMIGIAPQEVALYPMLTPRRTCAFSDGCMEYGAANLPAGSIVCLRWLAWKPTATISSEHFRAACKSV